MRTTSQKIILILLVSSSVSFAQWTQTGGPNYTGERINTFAKKDNYIFIGSNGYGAYRSSDYGSTWVQKINGLANVDVTALAVYGSEILAGTWGEGVFLSSDNGDTWIQMNNGLPSGQVYALTVSGSNIIAATGNGVFISADNGNSWQFALSGNVVSLAEEPVSSSSDILYSACNAYNSGIYRSTDHGMTWSFAGLDVGTLSIAAKGDTLFAGTYYAVMRSTNAGVNWVQTSNGMPSTIVWSLLIANDKVYAGTASGLYFSSDEGINWTLFGSPLVQKTVNAAYLNNGKLFAGTNEYGVIVSTDNGSNWDFSNNGLVPLPVSSLIAVNQNLIAGTGAIYLTNDEGNSWILKKLAYTNGMSFDGSNLYVNTADDSIFKSTDLGNTWTGFASSRPSVFTVHGDDIFIESILSDDKPNGVIKGGGEDKITGVFRSTNFGATYSCVLMVNNVYALASFNNEVYTYTSLGAFKTTNNGDNWVEINSGLGTGVSGFYFNNNEIYAASSNGAFKSTDDGARWYAINSGLDDLHINAFAFSGNYVFTATNSGVYASANNGVQWFKLNTSLPSGNTVISLAVISNYLFAGTYDRAVWKFPIFQVTGIPTSQSNIPVTYALHQNYPNPFNPTTKIKFDIAPLLNQGGVAPTQVGDGVVTLKIYDILGREVTTLVNQQLQPGTYNIEWNASNYPSGIYFYKLQSSEFTITKKMLLIK